jgi:hypothetical protein
MVNFESFYQSITSDEIWTESVSGRHKTETFKEVCFKVFKLALSDPEQFKIIPVSEHRKHVVNVLAKILPDKPKGKSWDQVEREKIEKKEADEKEKEWKPVSEEERKFWLKKWQEEIDKFQDNRIKPLLDGQVEEIGQTDPPKPKAKYRPYTPAEFIIDRDIHFKWIAENVNPDNSKKEGYLDEEIWRELHGYPEKLNYEIV